jgi:ring-1,2-phenylacetyl-CoA epoxidase subunit PaaD
MTSSEDNILQEEQKIKELLDTVSDPEIPALSVMDLGIIREVHVFISSTGSKEVEIGITPTYSGCPAMDVITINIRMALLQYGYKEIRIISSLSPAWTTDWISEKGKAKLKAYGIAPPNPTHSVCELELFQQQEAIECPRCSSFNTRMVSQFGSTPCKSLYQCNECKEPFEYFKCH